MKIPIAILASGRGSNFEAIARAILAGKLSAEIRVVISDQKDAPVLAKAEALGLKAVHVPPNAELRGDARRAEHERRIVEEIERVGARFVVMAGYMRIVTPYLIERFRSKRGYSRIVNIHPSLLPAFPGVNAYAQAFDFGAKLTGVTVHLVELEVDSGPICAQESFSIEDCTDAAQVEARGLALEHKLYPQALEWVLAERFTLEKDAGGRTYVRPA